MRVSILQSPRRRARARAFASFGLSMSLGVSLAACTKEPAPQSSVAETPDPVTGAHTSATPDAGAADTATEPAPEPEPTVVETPRPSEGPGVAVGEVAPSFSLTAADGSTVTLAGLVGQAPVALVFFRSADW